MRICVFLELYEKNFLNRASSGDMKYGLERETQELVEALDDLVGKLPATLETAERWWRCPVEKERVQWALNRGVELGQSSFA